MWVPNSSPFSAWYHWRAPLQVYQLKVQSCETPRTTNSPEGWVRCPSQLSSHPTPASPGQTPAVKLHAVFEKLCMQSFENYKVFQKSQGTKTLEEINDALHVIRSAWWGNCDPHSWPDSQKRWESPAPFYIKNILIFFLFLHVPLSGPHLPLFPQAVGWDLKSSSWIAQELAEINKMKLIYIEMDSLPCQLPIICKTRILLTNKVLQAWDFPPASTTQWAALRCAFLTSKEKGIATIFSQIRLLLPKKTCPKEEKNRCSWAFYQFFHPEAAFEEFVTEKNLLWAEANSGHFCEKPTTTPPALHTACASPTKIILFLYTFVKNVGRSKVDVYNWILHYPNPHYTPVCLKGWQYPLPQMSTVHAQLLQKRRIYHYPWILSWKALFLLTFTTWRVFPKWHQVILFKKNISFSYFSLSAMNMHWNSPHPHASQFTPTAQALLQQKFWRSAALKQPQTRTSLHQGLGKRECLCSSIRRKGRSKHEHSPMACFPAQSTSLHRMDLLLWTLALSVEPNRRGSWPCAQTTSNSPVTVLRADGYLYTLTHGTVHLLKKETSNKDFQTFMLKTKYSVLKLTPACMHTYIHLWCTYACMYANVYVCQCNSSCSLKVWK